MGRLALLVLVALCAPAYADRVACDQQPITVGKSQVLRGQLLKDAPTIERDEASEDITPPSTPRITNIVIASETDEEWVSIDGTFDPDTVLVRVDVGDYSMITTPDHLRTCSSSHVLQHREHLKVWAFDAAGNASGYYDAYVDVIGGREHHDRHGMDVLILIGAIVLACGLFVCIILIGMARKKAPYTVAGELLSPILAENVARLVARGYLIKLGVSMVIVLGLATLHHPYFAILVAPFPVVWLFEVFMTRLVLGQFDTKIQRLEKRENWIYINSSKLYAPYKIWEKASALPSATLSTRD